MERKLTILMRALLAVALVAITLALTYEFWRAGNGKSSLDVQEIRLQASISRYPPQHKGHQARVRPALSTYLPTISSCYPSSQRLPS